MTVAILGVDRGKNLCSTVGLHTAGGDPTLWIGELPEPEPRPLQVEKRVVLLPALTSLKQQFGVK